MKWLLIPASLLLLTAQAVSPPPNSDCTFDAKTWSRPERDRWIEISALTGRASRGRPVKPGNPLAEPVPRRNFIDEELFVTMERDGIKPTVLATDEEFLRRVSLDLTGQIPESDAVRAFLADSSADKRSKMIDQLVNSEAFTDRWTMWFGDLVQNVQASTFTREYPQGRNAFYRWIRDSILADKPYDQMVREVLAGKGENFVEGPANYVVRQLQPNGPIQDTFDNLSAHSGERFLGMPLNCISCHDGLRHLEAVNSYLSTRKRMDFWKNAAFFAQTSAQLVRDPANPNVRKYNVGENPAGAYRLNTVSGNKSPRQPEPGQSNIIEPAFFLSGEKPNAADNRREAYGRFLTAHPQFARASVNYLWREMFGLALVEPPESIDLLRIDPAKLPPGATIQTLHPQLLNRLGDWFRTNNYSLRAALKLMANSSAYQLSMVYTPGEWNDTWAPYFARHLARRLSSEVLLDAIFRATGVGAMLQVTEMPAVPRAMMLPDTTEAGGGRPPYGRFLNTFGRGDRDDTPRTDESSITQSLSLLNDTLITTRVRANTNGSTIQRVLASSREPAQVAEGLYLATLSRRPSAAESAAAVEYLQSGDIARKAEDLQYVLLNSLEFLFN